MWRHQFRLCGSQISVEHFQSDIQKHLTGLSISSGLIRLKSGEPFSFICITVVLWSCSIDEILITPLNYCRYCCCRLSFDYTRPWDKPGHRTRCLQGCSVLEDCCGAEVEGVWC